MGEFQRNIQRQTDSPAEGTHEMEYGTADLERLAEGNCGILGLLQLPGQSGGKDYE